GDISVINEDSIPDHDLFTYSFPCQDLSTFGTKLGCQENSGTRSSLLWSCKKIIEIKKPKFLLLENVKNLIGKTNKPNFDRWLSFLESQGYKNYYETLDSCDYGVPQRRKRVFVVSILNEFDNIFTFPEKIKLHPLENFIENNNQDFLEYKIHLDKIDFKLLNENIQFLDDRDWNFNGVIISNICSTQRAGRKGIKLCKLNKQNKLIYREITAYESWRLMGISRYYFERVKKSSLSNSSYFKLAGNAIVVNVLEEIFRKLLLRRN
ncbi:MAG: DNA (cytosine-5-)-methyltransferase, partial [Cetobacterium sp.]